MPNNPILFVGSSNEAKGLINGLQVAIDDGIVVRPWPSIAWPLSRGTLDGVETMLNEADFAAFILAADDGAVIRGKKVNVPRDNVLFELGMSFGSLGRDRTFMLVPKDTTSDDHLPTDLAGTTVIPYERDGDPEMAMIKPAALIQAAIRKEGRRDRVNGAFERGDTTRIEVLADGALHVFQSRNAYVDELRQALLKGKPIPAKVQFAQGDGGRHWLKLCGSRKYHYFKKATAQLRTHVPHIVEKVREAAGTTAIDFISLGCGDGSKDGILLRALASKLEEREYVYYYPVDISDILLVEAVRHVSRSGLARERFRCKPVLGDFTSLSSFSDIIAHRPNTNLFSVLGNVLGSFDEADILNSVAGAMRPGDLVLIEANVGSSDDSLALLKDPTADQWDLSTLDALDIPRASCTFDQCPEEGRSDVPGTTTLVSYAEPTAGTGKYTLSAMHHYDAEQLTDYVGQALDVEWIHESAEAGVCLLLGQRPENASRRRRAARA